MAAIVLTTRRAPSRGDLLPPRLHSIVRSWRAQRVWRRSARARDVDVQSAIDEIDQDDCARL
ncbi:MAG: hypothetical protein DMD81_06650 [Candidatus Rokuibacteriota bacterium]|nr:MAG: hypothetical protein DMD81_06650 [Candidatus Rokubacteria bacterium]